MKYVEKLKKQQANSEKLPQRFLRKVSSEVWQKLRDEAEERDERIQDLRRSEAGATRRDWGDKKRLGCTSFSNHMKSYEYVKKMMYKLNQPIMVHVKCKRLMFSILVWVEMYGTNGTIVWKNVVHECRW